MSDSNAFSSLTLAASTRDQILNATMVCLIHHGPKGTNISSIATQASVSRPTVYAYFETLPELLQEAISRGTQLLCQSITEHARSQPTAEDRLVAAFEHILSLSQQVDVLRQPMSFHLPDTDRDVLPDEAIIAARQVLAHLLDDLSGDDDQLNEMAETAVRFFLSLAAFKRPLGRDADIAGYVRRVILPAMGLA